MVVVTRLPPAPRPVAQLLAFWTMVFLPSTQRARGFVVLLTGVVGFLIGEVVALLGDTVAASVTHLPGGVNALTSLATPPWWSSVCGLVGLWVGMLGAVVWVNRRGILPWVTGTLRPRGFGDLRYLAMGIVAQWLVDAAYRPWHVAQLNNPVHKIFGNATGATFVVLCLLTAVGAPVVEECLFRATVFRVLAQSITERWGRSGIAVAATASAVLFGLAHGELVQLPGLIGLGIVLAAVYYRTERLLPSVLVHVGFNGVAVLSLALQRWHG